MTSLTNNITTALLSFFGLSSIAFGIKAYFVDAVQSTGLNLENSAIAVIFSIVGALLTALMKFMNSMKNVDENIAKNVQLCEKQLEISNKNFETQNKILDSQSRIFEVLNKTLDKQADLLNVVKDSVIEEIVDVDRTDRTDRSERIDKFDWQEPREQRQKTDRFEIRDRKALPKEDSRRTRKPESSGVGFPIVKRTPPPKNR